MSTARRSTQAYGYNHARPQYSFTAQRDAPGSYLEAHDPDAGAISYTALSSANWPALERERLAGPRRRLVVWSAAGLVAVVLLGMLVGLPRGPGGARTSRWSGANVFSNLLNRVAGAPAPVEAAAAPPARTAPETRPAGDGPRQAVARHTDDFKVVAPPSISAAQIDRVLDSYHSPATGAGATFYDLGVQYGIDPAYALAFYIHESAAGTKGVARFTHSIGNIRTTPGYADYEGYRSYQTYAAGIEDWYKLIKELYVEGWGLTTPDSILLRYAPWGDNNNPVVYANNVKQLVDSWQEK